MGARDPAPWRRQLRRELIAKRCALAPDEQARIAASVRARLRSLRELRDGPVAFYVAIRGEIDLLPLARELAAEGIGLALPVIVQRRAPMEFRSWQPGEPLVAGVWGIPVPPRGRPLRPRTVLVPVVGFDRAGYRLGYGGGYFDRTLGVLRPRPRVIGVGHAFSELDTIHPCPHDEPLDLVVTEREVRRFATEERAPGR